MAFLMFNTNYNGMFTISRIVMVFFLNSKNCNDTIWINPNIQIYNIWWWCVQEIVSSRRSSLNLLSWCVHLIFLFYTISWCVYTLERVHKWLLDNLCSHLHLNFITFLDRAFTCAALLFSLFICPRQVHGLTIDVLYQSKSIHKIME